MKNLLTVTLIAITACGGEDLSEEVGTRGSAITDGKLDSEHVAVALVRYEMACVDDADSSCWYNVTGTLVGKRSILTAAHAIEKAQRVEVDIAGVSYPVTSWKTHPENGLVPTPEDSAIAAFAPTVSSSDLAILRLASAPPIDAYPVAGSAPAAETGVVLVGYGQTSGDASESGEVRRSAKNVIGLVDEYGIYFEGTGDGKGNICNGDNGGPALVQHGSNKVVYGVASIMWGACGHLSEYVRVDVALDWLKQAAEGDLLVHGEDSAPSPTPNTGLAPPQVRILSPAHHSTVGTLLDVSAQVVDDGRVAGVALRIDGVEVATLQQGPYAFQVEVSPGGHVIEIVAHDTTGKEGRDAISVVAFTDATTPSDTARPMPKGGCSVGTSARSFGLPLALLALLLVRRRRAATMQQ